MNILLAFDSFKMCLSAEDVCAAVAKGFDIYDTIYQLPLSDGGEGFSTILTKYLHGQMIGTTTHDALMRPIHASYGMVSINHKPIACIDVASASGLSLINESERNPMIATSFGTGELIADAIKHGCKKIILGMGGSATNDGGKGMLDALNITFNNQGLSNIGLLKNIELIGLYDTDIAFNDCTRIYGHQKGLKDTNLHELESRMLLLENLYTNQRGFRATFGVDQIHGTGAAGGIGGAIMAVGGQLKSGADEILNLLNFEQLLSKLNIDHVVTGEGCFDLQTLTGKLPMRVAARSTVPTWALAGQVEVKQHPLFQKIYAINDTTIPLQECIQPNFARKALELAAKQIKIEIKNYQITKS